jgi:hypothetical protein
VEINAPIAITKNVHLVANPGQTLAVTGTVTLSGSLFTVERGATFTLCGDGSGDITLQNSKGSAVTVEGAFIMDGGVISGNTNTAQDGGGVYVQNGGSFIMKDGSISGNTASNGGGVYVAPGAAFTMSGGEISDNTAGIGGGVYVNGTFTMAGGAVVAQEVYLASGKTIGVSGSLTPPTGEYSARITMADYTDGTTVLIGTGYTLTTGDISKFTLTTNPPMFISLSDNKGVIAPAPNMSVTVNGQLVYYDTLADAIAAATGTLQSPAVISLMDDIDVSASIAVANDQHITIVPSSGEVTINRSGSNTGSLFTVSSSASLTLAGNGNAQLVLDGGSDSQLTATAALVTVYNTGTLTMNNGVTLQNNENTSGHGGGVYVEATGEFTITGGEITGNTALGGGGVYVAGDFTMTGGKISENTAFGYDDWDIHETGYGGGVFIENGGSVTLSNCEISKNTTIGNGGGVYVSGGSVIMTNCEISENEAPRGGGVYMVGGVLVMTAG